MTVVNLTQNLCNSFNAGTTHGQVQIPPRAAVGLREEGSSTTSFHPNGEKRKGPELWHL